MEATEDALDTKGARDIDVYLPKNRWIAQRILEQPWLGGGGRSGEVLSRAGATGGSEMNGLYFEIRHQGEPVDPADWFRR